jgi:hypothetical protein
MEEQETFEGLWDAIVQDKTCLKKLREEMSDENESIDAVEKLILEHEMALISLPVESPQFDREKAQQITVELIATTASNIHLAAAKLKRVVDDIMVKVDKICSDAAAAEESVKSQPVFYLGRHAYPQWSAYYASQRIGDLQAALAEYKACIAQAQLVAAKYELLK